MRSVGRRLFLSSVLTGRGASSRPQAGTADIGFPTGRFDGKLWAIAGKLQQEDIAKVKRAYMMFFDHIKYRKQWETPPFTAEQVEELFDEGARMVVRIRLLLDEQSTEAKLRQVDGNAQVFLHSNDAPSLLRQAPREFLVRLVHSTFQDARGYVEGLDKAVVSDLIAEMMAYQYNPRCHAWHLASALTHDLGTARIGSEPEKPDVGTLLTQSNYTTEEQDKKWHEAMEALYKAAEKVRAAIAGSAKPAPPS